MNHKWSSKLSKAKPWATCLNCGITKQRDYACGQIYIREGNDGGQSDKMWFGTAPPCIKITKE